MTNEANESGALETERGADQSQQDTTELDTTETNQTKPDDRVMRDMHRYKQQVREYERKLAEAQKRIESVETEKLKEKEDYKTLAEKRAERIAQLEGEYSSLEGMIYKNAKLNAVRSEAVKMGLRPEAADDLDLLDLSSVVVERTDRGRIAVDGHKDFVNELRRLKPHWFRGVVDPNINTQGGTKVDAAESPISASDVNAAEKKWRMSKKEADRKEWLEKLNKFKELKKGKSA